MLSGDRLAGQLLNISLRPVVVRLVSVEPQ